MRGVPIIVLMSGTASEDIRPDYRMTLRTVLNVR